MLYKFYKCIYLTYFVGLIANSIRLFTERIYLPHLLRLYGVPIKRALSMLVFKLQVYSWAVSGWHVNTVDAADGGEMSSMDAAAVGKSCVKPTPVKPDAYSSASVRLKVVSILHLSIICPVIAACCPTFPMEFSSHWAADAAKVCALQHKHTHA